MQIHLTALGCRLNEAEINQWTQDFEAQGHQVQTQSNNADLIVLNTCAVTGEASRKSRNLINRLKKQAPNAKLVVTGCHASLHPKEVADHLNVDLVVTNAEKDQLAYRCLNQFELTEQKVPVEHLDTSHLYSRGRHRGFIKVQDGCRYRCTFCIVTVARGEERSRRIQDIINEINLMHAQGTQEVVITGVHVGGYGSDIDSDLTALLDALLKDCDIPRIRLASVEPWDLPDQFFTLFNNPRLMPHMHLPLQSGADSVLRRMARRCRRDDFRRLSELAKGITNDFNITTDIITGFPGETDEEWQQTMEFCEEMGFGHVHIFPYSARSGTKAAGLPNQIPMKTRKQRAQELHVLARRMKNKMLETALETRQEVLWERSIRQEEGHYLTTGYTPNFLRVETHSDADAWSNHITHTDIHGINVNEQRLMGSAEAPAAMRPSIIPIHAK